MRSSLTIGNHIVKTGAEALGLFVHDYARNTFNGSYIFGGGRAPALDDNNQPKGQPVNLTPLQQYSRALQNLPGGSPTTSAVTTETPMPAAFQLPCSLKRLIWLPPSRYYGGGWQVFQPALQKGKPWRSVICKLKWPKSRDTHASHGNSTSSIFPRADILLQASWDSTASLTLQMRYKVLFPVHNAWADCR
jgi:hypothetical protein